MHTPPPAPDPDITLPVSPGNGFDSSWAIFDQNSIPIAAQSLLLEQRQPMNSHTAMEDGRQNPGIPGHYDPRAQQAFEIDGLRYNNEQYADAWPSTILRLFGNAESIHGEQHRR